MRKFNLFNGVKAVMAFAVVAMGLIMASCEKEDFDIKPSYNVGAPNITVNPGQGGQTVDKATVVIDYRIFEKALTRAAGDELTQKATLLYKPKYNEDGSIPAQVMDVTVMVPGYQTAVIPVTLPAIEKGYTCTIAISVEVLPENNDPSHGHETDHGHDSDHGHGTGNAGGGTSK